MSRILCGVDNCSHNNSGTCYADRINIGGKSSSSVAETCCGSFLNRALYSDLTNNVSSGGSCDCLICHVKSCEHYDNSLCTLESIEVGGKNPQIYTETNCKSFNHK